MSSFLRLFPEAKQEKRGNDILDGRQPKLCEFSCHGYRCVAALLNGNDQNTKTQGKVPAAVFTARLLSRFMPRYLVNVGIACRLDDEVCELGGVIVGDHLIDVTGDCSIEDGGTPEVPKLIFTPGKKGIPCDPDVVRFYLDMRENHNDAYTKWYSAASEATTSALPRLGPKTVFLSDLSPPVIRSLRPKLSIA